MRLFNQVAPSWTFHAKIIRFLIAVYIERDMQENARIHFRAKGAEVSVKFVKNRRTEQTLDQFKHEQPPNMKPDPLLKCL